MGVIAVQFAGSLFSLLGLLAIFLTWRRKGVRAGAWRYGLPAGWALLVLGLIVWTISTNPDQGLALGSVAVMILACAFLAWQGLKLTGKPAKTQAERESATDTLALGKGYWGRFTVRLLGSLIIVPAFGLLIGLLWRAYAPGNAADVLIAAAFIVTFALTGALTWLLASRRPYRTCAALTLASLVAAGVIYLPLLGA
jgi:hypothetical protein